jgi:hypothetical protein
LTDPNFRELKEHVLAALPDEQLIAYIQKARTAARTEAMTLALSVLVFGYLDIVTRRVVLKVPPADVDDVAHEAILSAIRSAFSGESIGEFRGWLNRITSRRIADYHRRLEGKPKTVPLLSGDEEDDAGWGEVPAAEFEGVSVDAERAIETAYRVGCRPDDVLKLCPGQLAAISITRRRSGSLRTPVKGELWRRSRPV